MIHTSFVSEAFGDFRPDGISEEDIRYGFPSNFVMSRNPDGTVRSYYESECWDYTPYSATPVKFYFYNRPKFEFLPDDIDGALRSRIVEECKRIFALFLYSADLQRRSLRGGEIRKPSSFKPYFSLLKAIAKAAARSGICLAEAHKSDQFSLALMSSIKSLNARQAGILPAIIRSLALLNEYGYRNVPEIVSEKNRDQFFEAIQNRQDHIQSHVGIDRKATPLIPSRIISHYISGALDWIEYAEPYVSSVTDFFTEFYENPYFYMNDTRAFKKRYKEIYGDVDVPRFQSEMVIPHKKALKKYGLGQLLESLDIKIYQNTEIRRLRSFLRITQSCVRVLCHAFSGMRVSEVAMLSNDCLEWHDIPGLGRTPFLRGFTTKIEQYNYSKPTYWVTSPELEAAIRVGGKISRICEMFFLKSSKQKFDTVPLFPSVNPSMSDLDNHVHHNLPLFGVAATLSDINEHVVECRITEDDIRELEVFDMFRDWRNEESFEIGAAWPLATHQFRRSLAVYASKTGLVSLPSISVQFKHMSLSMTMLYGENASFAVNMIDKDHDDSHANQALFVEEFNQLLRVDQAINFNSNVIHASGRLSGGVGKIIQTLKDKDEMPEWLADRKETERRFIQGQQSYRETIVGGCANPNPCDKAGLGGISACPECEHSILGGDNGEKNEAYLRSLELSLEFMEAGTPAYEAVRQEVEKRRGIKNVSH